MRRVCLPLCLAVVGAWLTPSDASAAPIDASVSVSDPGAGPVRLLLHNGAFQSGTKSHVRFHGGHARLVIEGVTSPVTVSCTVGAGVPADKTAMPFEVTEGFYDPQTGSPNTTGKTISQVAGKYSQLSFVVMPNPPGDYLYDISSVPATNSWIAGCTVKSLETDSAPTRGRGVQRKGRSAASKSRGATAAARIPSTARFEGKRALTRIKPGGARSTRLSKTRATRTKPAPMSHAFGAYQIDSESQKVRVLSSRFVAHTPEAIAFRSTYETVVMVLMGDKSTKLAVFDCSVTVQDNVGPNFAISVGHAGGSTTSMKLSPGKQQISFAVPRVIGIETLTIKGNGGESAAWSLHRCEVALE